MSAATAADPELLALARYARAIAAGSCDTGSAGGDGPSCGWYHGFWPQLRLLGLGSDPLRHRDFFEFALAGLPRSEAPVRILVSGTADHAMPTLLRSLWTTPDQPPEVTVLDKCPTPGRLWARYARSRGWPARTETADLLTWRPRETFDAVVTHSLLRLVAPQERGRVIAAWCKMLRPGGRVITVTRLAGPRASPTRPATAGRTLAQAARAAAIAQPGACIMPVGEIALAAERFGRSMPGYPPSTAEETAALFENGGFSLLSFNIERRHGAANLAHASGGVTRDARYAEIIAERRAW